MVYQTWLIAGIIMLAITLFVHKHTKDYHKNALPLPLWAVLIAGVIACVPLINFVAFGAGAIMYIYGLLYDDIEFSCEAKWYKRLIKVLTRDLNKI